MKIEQKGLSTTPSATTTAAMPVYAGATKVDTLAGIGSIGEVAGIGSIPSGVQTEVYATTGSINDILNYYRTEMVNVGWVEPWWTGQYDNSGSMSFGSISATVGVLCFEKGDEGVEVFALSYTYQGESCTYFALMEGPSAALTEWDTMDGGTIEAVA